MFTLWNDNYEYNKVIHPCLPSSYFYKTNLLELIVLKIFDNNYSLKLKVLLFLGVNV